MSENKYNVVLKATSFFGGVQGLNIVLNVIRTKIVAVLLGPEGVGLNAIYNETRETLHSTSNLGLDVSGVRGVSMAYEEMLAAGSESEKSLLREKISGEVRLLRSWVVLLALFGTFLCMVFAAPLSLLTFGDYEHTWGYVLLSPAVGFSTVLCGELAVLKGLRQLKRIATVSVLKMVAGLVVTLPIYYIWGIDGVLAALVALFFVCMLLACYYGNKAEKFSVIFTKRELRRGHKMLTVGFNFVVCSIIAHLSLLGIQVYLNNVASLEIVGLYNSGYSLTMTYAGMVFSAIDMDYFPRLTGVITDCKERADTLLKQMDVVAMLATPLCVGMTVALPMLVPLLLDGRFETVIPMAQAATVGLLFRAIYLPNAYMSLAAGDNKTFLAINIVGAVDILLVLVGYHYYGLTGMGVALTIQNGIDMLLVLAVSKWKYGIRFTLSRGFSLCIYTAFLCLTYAACRTLTGWEYWITGTVLTLLTVLYSYKKYKKA